MQNNKGIESDNHFHIDMQSDKHFHMVDVGEKPVTYRFSVAQGQIALTKEAYDALVHKSLPKGDVLKLAEIAGVLASKKTSDLIPLCHPIAIEKVDCRCNIEPDTHVVKVSCRVSGHAKTGFEMEALTGVSAALLTIYDCVKSISSESIISEVRLTEKAGGKSGHVVVGEHKAHKPLDGISFAVLTISDRVAAGTSTDTSGPAIVDFLKMRGGKLHEHSVVADDIEAIRRTVRLWAFENNVKLMITTGGTGLGPRDVTPEAFDALWTRKIPGISEVLRLEGAKSTPFSWLTRLEAGLVGNTLVIQFPGSKSGVQEGLVVLERLIPHALHILSGGGHE